ncbi:MAG: sigma-70 family RNA polymerase sigma factor [Gemmatimonadales bacterium]
MDSSQSEVTQLLVLVSDGNSEALDRLLPLVYDELKMLAASHLRRERGDHTLSPTALVHEVFLRLVGQHSVNWAGRAHFFGIAAQAMRRILVDHARRRTAYKRGRQHQVTLDTNAELPDELSSDEVMAVDEALAQLAELDPRQAKLVELRYFAGFSIEETAAVLGISTATVKRDWALARAWLQRQLGS